MLLLLLLLLTLLALASAANEKKKKKRQCYGIDGTPSGESSQPCNADAVFSPCCDTNKAKPDICLSSGLCYAQDSGFEGFIYSNGCTDPTGMADACPHVCPDRTNNWKGGPVVGSYNVLQCSSGNHFCCRKAFDSENCCGNTAAAVSVNVGQLVLPTPTPSPSPTTSAVCHPDRAVSAEQCPKDSSVAVVAGAVGGVLGAALLASLGALAVVCLRRKRGTTTTTTTGPQAYESHQAHGYSHTPSMGAQHELPNRPVHEMQGSQYKAGGYNPSNPLRVIAHIDLDAFYAQCEMVRLAVPEDKPLAVQQQGLIAVNYPAREAGISRHCDVAEARKLCPDLIAQHVATWREGQDGWAYRDDAAANIASDKVSLDPYRLESRKILATVKETLPPHLQRIEKASIDEVFLDLSAHVHSVLLDRFPDLACPPPYDDPAERLPPPPVVALDWADDALAGLEEDEEARDPDWDDVAMLLGSEIVRSVRAAIRDRLGYTCSAGVANNKLLSKLGSGFHKPNRQTVIRARAAHSFLGSFRLSKLRSLGGKLGDQVVSTFNAERVDDLRAVSLDNVKAKLGDETGLWLYKTLRGVDTSEVNPRTQIKSMLSAKSFRPSIDSPDQAVKWLAIFVADIYARLVEEGVADNKRRPRTMNLHHRSSAGQTRSRQGPIPQGKTLDRELLLQIARDLLGQAMADGNVWPCANLSLSVGGFEDGIKGNLGIGAFLVKTPASSGQQPLSSDSLPGAAAAAAAAPRQNNNKRPRIGGDDGGLHRFFAKNPPFSHTGNSSSCNQAPPNEHDQGPTVTGDGGGGDGGGDDGVCSDAVVDTEHAYMPPHAGEEESPVLRCSRCLASFEDAVSLQSHSDWHLAKDLESQQSPTPPPPPPPPPSSRGPLSKKPGPGTRRGRGGKMEPGQTRLDFG
ncbi:hypothetical protein CP532_0662, partial [Ophiocordyceps camponoti-leonardi (nom. inval.)]